MSNPAMERALLEARAAAARGEVPVGAVLTGATGTILAAAGNQVEAKGDPTAHAEMLVLREAAAKLGTKYLSGCTLTITLEPCAMCAGAIAAYRVPHLVFGAYDPKSGAVEHGPRLFERSTTHHRPEITGGVRDSECSALLANFFERLRDAPSQT